jgi:hypothetical protein
MKIKTIKIPCVILAAAFLSALAAPRLVRADEVTDWNENMLAAAATAKLGPLPMSRVAARRELSLLQEARLLGQLNLALADAYICCWDAKYAYAFWRPVSAIQLGDADGNEATVADPTWTPLLVTPPFPDYPSGHSVTGGAAATNLAAWFGIVLWGIHNRK